MESVKQFKWNLIDRIKLLLFINTLGLLQAVSVRSGRSLQLKLYFHLSDFWQNWFCVDHEKAVWCLAEIGQNVSLEYRNNI